jgi:hypothetical protein
MDRLLNGTPETVKTIGNTAVVVLALSTLTIIGIVMFLFSLPFVLLKGGAGFKPNGIEDTFPKVNYAN